MKAIVFRMFQQCNKDDNWIIIRENKSSNYQAISDLIITYPLDLGVGGSNPTTY